jgi:hypothetical protein
MTRVESHESGVTGHEKKPNSKPVAPRNTVLHAKNEYIKNTVWNGVLNYASPASLREVSPARFWLVTEGLLPNTDPSVLILDEPEARSTDSTQCCRVL